MPRLNIDDSIFKDRRFAELMIKIGSRTGAIGTLVEAWLVAQSFWIPERKLIPHEVFEREGLSTLLVDVGLAIKKPDGVYLCGIKDNFQWWFNGIEQRKQAGKKSAEARLKRFGTAQPLPERPFNDRKTLPNCAEPSSSSSSYEEERRIYIAHSRERDFEGDLVRIYQLYPRRVGKTRGFKILRRQKLNEGDLVDLEKAVTNYAKFVQGKDPEYTKLFYTFAGEWRDWVTPDFKTPEELAKENLANRRYADQETADAV